MVHNQCIEASPSIKRQLHSLLRQTKIRHVASEHFDALGAVLVVQLVEGGVRARDEDEFVGVREEVVGCGEADSCGIVRIYVCSKIDVVWYGRKDC